MNRKQIINALRARGITFDGQSSTPVLNGLLRDSWLTVSVRNEGTSGTDYSFELTINGVIGTTFFDDEGYSSRQYQDALAPFMGKKGLLNINSPGGNLWEGLAIAEMNKAQGQIDTKILGVAASAADVIFQSGRNRLMPKASERMGHFCSGNLEVIGNADEIEAAKPEVDKLIQRLRKHDETLAKMYANRSGQSLDDVKADMKAEEFMDGDESLEKGYCDQLTEDAPVENRISLDRLNKFPTAILNHFTEAPKQGSGKTNHQLQQQETTVNKAQKIALLNSWGVKLPTGQTAETVTDAWLDETIAKGKPISNAMTREIGISLLNSWGVAFAATATDTEIENLVAAGKPKAVIPPANGNGNIVNFDDHPTVKAMRAQMDTQRRDTLRNRITEFASQERIPANQIEDWVNDAFAATDHPVNGNPIIARLAALEPRAPGVPALTIDVGNESLNIAKLDKLVAKLLAPTDSITRNGIRAPNKELRETISANSKKISSLVNSMKKIEVVKDHPHGVLVGPLRDGWDAWAAGIQNANTMGAGLLRQVILSEMMRAFRREFSSLNIFSHNYKDVALQGTDKVEVPYYPLDTTASTEFVQATGYTAGANAVTNAKEIIVGGIGNNVASSGSGRKYKALQFSAYELARQPYLNIAQNIVLAGEQLAIDVRADILGTHIKAANFGNAIWTGAAGAFDKSAFTNYLLNAAIKAFWPMGMRNAVLTPDFYTALLGDPGLQRVNEAGSDSALRDGVIGRLLGFNSVNYDALLPVANFIRGGDGNVTGGPDLNLAGFIACPSAILIATAPVMPGPATMRLLAAYEQVTDDQTGLTFSYQYSGDVKASVDNEFIECAYGSGLGELAALKRFTTAGV